jgi:hypothetical protein
MLDLKQKTRMLIGREAIFISFRARDGQEVPTTTVGFDIEDEDVDPKEGGV